MSEILKAKLDKFSQDAAYHSVEFDPATILVFIQLIVGIIAKCSQQDDDKDVEAKFEKWLDKRKDRVQVPAAIKRSMRREGKWSEAECEAAWAAIRKEAIKNEFSALTLLEDAALSID